jgi:hypothetical protein
MNMQLQHINNNTALEVPADYIPVAGIENLSPDDFSIPAMKLVQDNTDIKDANQLAGQWYRTDTGATSETVKALIIGIQKTRVLFKSQFGGEKKALCRSDNSIAPREEFINASVSYIPGSETRDAVVSPPEGNQFDMVLPALCSDCPLSEWGQHGEPPACRLSDGWAALTSEGDPILFRFGGSAAKISAKLRNLARAATSKRRPLYVELSSHREETDKGNYYVPDVTLLKEALPADLLDTAKAFVGLNLAARAAEMMPDDEETTNATPNTRSARPIDTDPDWSQINDAADVEEIGAEIPF